MSLPTYDWRGTNCWGRTCVIGIDHMANGNVAVVMFSRWFGLKARYEVAGGFPGVIEYIQWLVTALDLRAIAPEEITDYLEGQGFTVSGWE